MRAVAGASVISLARERAEGTLREHHLVHWRARAVTLRHAIPFLARLGCPRVPLPTLPASSLDGKEGVVGSSPPEGFEKSLQAAIYRARALLAAGDKGRTRSHAGGTEHVDRLSFPHTKEELTRLAETLRDFPVGEFS
jgi:hypothetical protein